jgi:hypothetical protein
VEARFTLDHNARVQSLFNPFQRQPFFARPQRFFGSFALGKLSLHSLPLDTEIKNSLPGGVTLDRANADLIRALIAEGRLNRSIIDSLVDDLSRQIKRRSLTLLLQLSYCTITAPLDGRVGDFFS